MLDESGQIADLALLAVGFDFPELAAVSIAFMSIAASQPPTRTLLSPPAVARRPLPWGSKWAE